MDKAEFEKLGMDRDADIERQFREQGLTEEVIQATMARISEIRKRQWVKYEASQDKA